MTMATTTHMDITRGLMELEAADAANIVATNAAVTPEVEAPPRDTTADQPDLAAIVAEAVSPLQEELIRLRAELAQTQAQKPTVDPQTFEVISSIHSEVERLKLDTMTSEDQVAYLLKQRDAEQGARVQQVREQAKPPVVPPPTNPDPLAAQWQTYDTIVYPTAVELAATLGISDADAAADIKKYTIQPIKDAAGNVKGLDFKAMMNDLRTTWQGRAAKRDEAREAARGGGDAGRPGGRPPSALDPWDPKFNGDINGSLRAGAAAGIFG